MRYRILSLAMAGMLLCSCSQTTTEPEPEDTWAPMLEGYKIIQQDGGREHVVLEIIGDMYEPIEDYPELEPYCEEDLKESKEHDAPYTVDVAPVDFNGDGNTDYVMRINSFAFGKASPIYKLLLGAGGGTLQEIDIGWVAGDIAFMDTETNGLPDIAFSGSRYRLLYHYRPDFYQDGRDVYTEHIPSPLYISNELTSYDSCYIKDGKLYWEARLDVNGFQYQPFYIGATFEQFDGLLREPILWAHDGAGNILELEQGGGSLTCWFVGDVLDEDKINEILSSYTVSDPIFPDDYVFAYVESLYYPKYSLAIKPHLRPENEHEKSLLMRLGAEAQKYLAEALEELESTNPSMYEMIKDSTPEFITCIYEDFDGDGACEMLAEIAAAGTFHIWFADDDVTALIDSNFSSFSVVKPFIINVQGQSFAIFKGYGAVSFTRDCMIGFREGLPYKTNISGGMVDGTNEYDEVLVIQTIYDACTDGTGRTWKPYWFYLDEDGEFKEYTGVEITLAELEELAGARALLDEYLPADAEITGIFRRGNGIVNVNYIVTANGFTDNNTLTIRYNGTECIWQGTGRGKYLAAISDS